MIPITRTGDLSAGICSIGAPCCPHAWISVHNAASPVDNEHARDTMRIGDTGACTCPHCPTSFAVTGSSITHADGIPVHRLGDAHNVACGAGNVITADPVDHSS